MGIKDIVNRDLVNLVNCESEPIHVPGSIQPHGFLLVLNGSGSIEFCSANTEVYTAHTPAQLLGRLPELLFGKQQMDDFAVYVAAGIDVARPFRFSCNDIIFNTAVHYSGPNLLLELEPLPDGSLALPDLYTQTRKFAAYMESAGNLDELCRDIAAETRSITGYDRVMIYRFDKDYNGEVVAESKRADLISFAGQKYPHTDIPVQARQLYIRNMLRMIADVHYEPVPVLTLDTANDKDNSSLDLSLSVLRSVSPMHIEYLQNMGVGATLTISLLLNKQLWGLIACHHYTPKILPHYTRLSALLQGHFLTSQISVRETAEEFHVAKGTDHALQQLLGLLQAKNQFISEEYANPFLLSLANASGALIRHDGRLYRNGKVPEDDAVIEDLVNKLSAQFGSNHFHTEKLMEVFPEAAAIAATAAGLIYHPMANAAGDCVLWFRQEVVETVQWAGNPQKPMLAAEDGMRLSPRKSFELWQEEVKYKSLPWRKSELNAASGFAYALQKHINLQYVQRQEEQYRKLNEELLAANKELSNINWISTHDLREPLRKIRIFASKILEQDHPGLDPDVRNSVERMQAAALKMQQLIEDIFSYAQTSSMEQVFSSLDLQEAWTYTLQELAQDIDARGALITADPLPVIRAIPFQARQLLVNLLSNALKFAREGVRPEIHLSCSVVNGNEAGSDKLFRDASYYKLVLADNGVGFEPEYATRIFEVFQRLHPSHTFRGTGIGLAICKKIMENHHGLITAEGVPGAGARFYLYFPVGDSKA